jgi:hypothetical protein
VTETCWKIGAGPNLNSIWEMVGIRVLGDQHLVKEDKNIQTIQPACGAAFLFYGCKFLSTYKDKNLHLFPIEDKNLHCLPRRS